MAHRSVILGYNHNIGYRGLVFHVQTEDSGVENPHVFTHLFHGGVIITTSKLEYDADASEEAVKALMQSQHKTILKGLKRGTYNEKIDAYLGNHPDLKPADQEPEKATIPSSPRNPDNPAPASEAPPAEVVEAAEIVTPSPLPPPPPPLPPPPPSTTGARQPRKYRRPTTSGPRRIQPAPPPVTSTLSKHTRPDVLISAAPIVVSHGKDGAAIAPSSPRPIRRARPRVVREESRESIFDQNLITEKSLDEVILAYLSEDSED